MGGVGDCVSFLTAAVTNDYDVMAENNPYLLSRSLWGLKSKVDLQSCVPARGSRGESISLPCPAYSHSLVPGPASLQPLLPCHISFFDPSFSASLWKSPCSAIWLTQTISSSQNPYLITSATFATSLLLWKVTYSQVPEIRMWTSLKEGVILSTTGAEI